MIATRRRCPTLFPSKTRSIFRRKSRSPQEQVSSDNDSYRPPNNGEGDLDQRPRIIVSVSGPKLLKRFGHDFNVNAKNDNAYAQINLLTDFSPTLCELSTERCLCCNAK